MWAIKKDFTDLELAKFIIAKGADIEARDNKNKTAYSKLSLFYI